MALFLLCVWTEAPRIIVVDVSFTHTVLQGARFAKMIVQNKACNKPSRLVSQLRSD